MKTIGLLGGITCESSLLYYKLVNEMTRAQLGGHHAAKSVMVSVDFAEIQPLTERGAWDEVLAILLKAAKGIECAGADLLVLCANTAHKLAAEIQREIGIPIVHIVDVTAREIDKAGFKKVGLLGTRFTMVEDFFKGRLREKFGVEALTPGKEDRERVHRVIIDELALGNIQPASRDMVLRVIGELAAQGSQAIILGCTELPLLVSQEQCPIPLFDTTTIHARAAVDQALGRIDCE